MENLLYLITVVVIIYKLQLTAAAKYKAYPGKYWHVGKCPLSSSAIALADCRNWCSSTADCTAFEHHNHGGACRLKNCAKPPPQPKRIAANYTAYALNTDDKVPGRMWNGNQCPYASSGGITLEVCRHLCSSVSDCTAFEHLSTGGGCELMNCPYTLLPTGRDRYWNSYLLTTCAAVTCGRNNVCYDNNGTEPGICKCKDGYFKYNTQDADCLPTCNNVKCGLNSVCVDNNGTKPGICKCKDGYIYGDQTDHIPEKAKCSMTLEYRVDRIETQLFTMLFNLSSGNSRTKNPISNSEINDEFLFIKDNLTDVNTNQDLTLYSIRQNQVATSIIIGLIVLLVIMLIITNIYTYLYFKKRIQNETRKDDCYDGYLSSPNDSYLTLLKATEHQ